MVAALTDAAHSDVVVFGPKLHSAEEDIASAIAARIRPPLARTDAAAATAAAAAVRSAGGGGLGGGGLGGGSGGARGVAAIRRNWRSCT